MLWGLMDGRFIPHHASSIPVTTRVTKLIKVSRRELECGASQLKVTELGSLGGAAGREGWRIK